MEPKLIAGGIAAAAFAVVAIGIGMLATRWQFRRRTLTTQQTVTAAGPRRLTTAGPARGTGCLALALVAMGGLVFAVAVIVLIVPTGS